MGEKRKASSSARDGNRESYWKEPIRVMEPKLLLGGGRGRGRGSAGLRGAGGFGALCVIASVLCYVKMGEFDASGRKCLPLVEVVAGGFIRRRKVNYRITWDNCSLVTALQGYVPTGRDQRLLWEP